MKPILEESEQRFYLADDNHKSCNQRFAAMLGFKSPGNGLKKGFLEVYVTEKSRETLSTAYWMAMEKKAASTIPMTWMKIDGTAIDSTMILAPMFFEGHMFSVHFVTHVASK
jgi:hypothetical protein